MVYSLNYNFTDKDNYMSLENLYLIHQLEIVLDARLAVSLVI